MSEERVEQSRNEWRRGKNSNCKIGLLKVTKCHSQRGAHQAESREKCTRVNDAEIRRRGEEENAQDTEGLH